MSQGGERGGLWSTMYQPLAYFFVASCWCEKIQERGQKRLFRHSRTSLITSCLYAFMKDKMRQLLCQLDRVKTYLDEYLIGETERIKCALCFTYLSRNLPCLLGFLVSGKINYVYLKHIQIHFLRWQDQLFCQMMKVFPEKDPAKKWALCSDRLTVLLPLQQLWFVDIFR